MKYVDPVALGDGPDEMAIVDTFTRLIFGDVGNYSINELQVIAALRCVEPDVAADDMLAMGEYLRALGVGEMVRLVSRVQQYSQHIQSQTPLVSTRRRPATPGRRAY